MKGNWSKAAIGGLVLLNLVLLVMLVLRDPPGAATAMPATSGDTTPETSPRSSPSRTSTAPTTTATSVPRRTPTATPSSPGQTPSTSAGSDKSTRILAVSSANIAWRAVFGPCPTEPDVEVSRDGGRTWRRSEPGLRSVSRLRAYNESAVFAIGGASGCSPRYVATGGPDESWFANQDLLGETWYRVPEQADQVHAPGGQLSRPCGKQLLDFAGLGDYGAAALCADGTLRMTEDTGRTWRDVEADATGLALGADQQTYALAMRQDGCDGIAVVLLEPDAQVIDREAVRCAKTDGDGGEELGVGVRGKAVWLWLDSKIMVSTNSGRTWDVTS